MSGLRVFQNKQNLFIVGQIGEYEGFKKMNEMVTYNIIIQ